MKRSFVSHLSSKRFRLASPLANRGFTLIEAMTVIAILAILAALAAPNMSRFVNMRRVESMAFRISEDLQFARSEALKRNARMLLCNDHTATDCVAEPTATSWTKGWRVCYDRDADNACDTSAATDPNPVRVTTAALEGITVSAGPTSRLRFDPVGTITSDNFDDFVVASKQDSSIRWTVRFAAAGSVVVRKG
jgi:prepilin-type N-terminal cleavage/methylation domain-containing protein